MLVSLNIHFRAIASVHIESFGSLFAQLVSDPRKFVQMSNSQLIVLSVVFSLLLAKFILL
jgi:hypothetical protein